MAHAEFVLLASKLQRLLSFNQKSEPVELQNCQIKDLDKATKWMCC